jgi:hypothetical protein
VALLRCARESTTHTLRVSRSGHPHGADGRRGEPRDAAADLLDAPLDTEGRPTLDPTPAGAGNPTMSMGPGDDGAPGPAREGTT